MAIFEKLEGFPFLKWAEGFIVGLLVVTLIAALFPARRPKPEIRVIEKQVVVNRPVYIDGNDRKQIQCLARNAYFEARNQSEKGMVAVSNVVMNRVTDERYPDTPCEVIYEKKRGVCQFSWVCEGKKKIRDLELYDRTLKIAEQVYIGNYRDVTAGAKFYHANYVNPRWGFERVKQIGAHIFYRG